MPVSDRHSLLLKHPQKSIQWSKTPKIDSRSGPIHNDTTNFFHVLKSNITVIRIKPINKHEQFPEASTEIANEVERRLQGCKKSIKVAVMGCVVNGPGEAREADIGIAGGKGEAVLFVHGEPVRKLTGDNILDQFMEEIDKL